MRLIYEIAIRLYRSLIIVASLFNPKARGWVKGRKNIFQSLSGELRNEHDKLAWFHCASLGEFEQGRPIIDAFKTHFPDFKLLITFFSPSGYEIRKNYPGADYVFYLPADTRINAFRFYSIVKPDVLFLVKYEYWYNYLDVLTRNDVPVYVISGVFRKSQHFFKWYGFWFRKQLRKVNYFFVQNTESSRLLNRIRITNVMISGDTRFDRVAEIQSRSTPPDLVSFFSRSAKVLVAGSTWPVDEALLATIWDRLTENIKLIIVPHEVESAHIEQIMRQFPGISVRLSAYNPELHSHARVLIVDRIGILSAVYRCARVAYVGGGFGKGIHNILEPAAYGVPVIFGPENRKFLEAQGLRMAGGGFQVEDKNQLLQILNEMFFNALKYNAACQASKAYIEQQKGATANIFKQLHLNIKV